MRNCLVIGCGRSGTSMVAGALAGAGYQMGPHLWAANPGNPKGRFESALVNAINEEIIRLSTPPLFRLENALLNRCGRRFGYEFINKQTRAATIKIRIKKLITQWQHPRHVGNTPAWYKQLPYHTLNWLARIDVGKTMKANAWLEQQIGALMQQQPYCFKDPRFCYTLPAWRPFLQDVRFICVFRQPALTATSLLAEVGAIPRQYQPTLTFADAVQLWSLMYQHVLKLHCHQGEWLFLHYQQLFQRTGLARLEAFVEANVDRHFPERSMQRSTAKQSVPWPSQQLYTHLCELASYAE